MCVCVCVCVCVCLCLCGLCALWFVVCGFVVLVGLPPQPDIPRSFLYSAGACKLVTARCKNKVCIFDRGPPVGRPAPRRPKNDSRPDFFWHCFGVHQNNSSDPSPTAKARFERVLASVACTPLYMGIAAGFDIVLVIAKASSLKATDQPVEQLGHGSSLDENVT